MYFFMFDLILLKYVIIRSYKLSTTRSYALYAIRSYALITIRYYALRYYKILHTL